MKISSEGKSALVTSAASGLGAEVTVLLRDAGATVVDYSAFV